MWRLRTRAIAHSRFVGAAACWTCYIKKGMSKVVGRGRRGADKAERVRDQMETPPRILTTLGAEASDRWLLSLGLKMGVSRWHVEISVATDIDSTFELNIYAEEWGFAFHHDGRSSWIRVTDIPFVHGLDDFHLLARTPDLLAINILATELEHEHGVSLRRANATIRTNIPGAAEVVLDWLIQPIPYSTVKKTKELCSDEMHHGIRCTKSKGHEGDHEYVTHDARGQLRWK